MFKKIFEIYKDFEKITRKILMGGLEFCFALCILSVSFLVTYNLFVPSPMVYYIGICLFRLSLIFGIEFIVCGFVTDGIKKQLI